METNGLHRAHPLTLREPGTVPNICKAVGGVPANSSAFPKTALSKAR